MHRQIVRTLVLIQSVQMEVIPGMRSDLVSSVISILDTGRHVLVVDASPLKRSKVSAHPTLAIHRLDSLTIVTICNHNEAGRSAMSMIAIDQRYENRPY